MATFSKKLGQFKQWTGERLGTAEKTDVSEDFRRLDVETESRREGVEKLTIALTDYAKTLDKRSSQDKKISVLSMLAKSMIQQGNFHGKSSKFGLALVKIGEAQDRIQGLQEEFAEKLRHGLLTEAMALHATMKNYASLKKKLENRRLDYDAKLNRYNKSKKEKPGLEEEMKIAQTKYNETLQDVEELMSTFAEREELLLDALVDFAHAQCFYFEKSSEGLKELREALSERHLEQKARDNSSKPDKAALLRRPSSLQTVLPPSLESAPLVTKPADASPEKEPLTQEQPKPISNLSRRSSIVHRQETPSARKSQHENCIDGPGDEVEKVTALYAFEAENDGEMTIKRGDVITVLRRIDSGWWYGRCNGVEGMFPANYVEPLTTSGTGQSSGDKDIADDNHHARLPSQPRDGPLRSRSSTAAVCAECGCEEFAANVFKPTKCKNCSHVHG